MTYTTLNEPKKSSRRSNALPNGSIEERRAKANGVHFTPRKTPKSPKKLTNGVSDVASSVASGPPKLNHVNGIIKHFDGVNGAGSSEAGSLSLTDSGDGAERKQQPPPKLKRKAPG